MVNKFLVLHKIFYELVPGRPAGGDRMMGLKINKSAIFFARIRPTSAEKEGKDGLNGVFVSLLLRILTPAVGKWTGWMEGESEQAFWK